MSNLEKRIKLFQRIEIETRSTCNRKCVSCIRNSIPNKDETKSWFETHLLEFDDIKRVFEQSKSIGFNGEICLSHFNEPLMDERIVDIAKMTRELGFNNVFFCSNGDYLTQDLATKLDGVVNEIGFALYANNWEQRRIEILSMFKKTKVTANYGEHMHTHHSPLVGLEQKIQSVRSNKCLKPLKRLIINHKGQMLMCCDDLTGHFDLGTIHENTVEELWYSEKHQNLIEELKNNNGRKHPWCQVCPR